MRKTQIGESSTSNMYVRRNTSRIKVRGSPSVPTFLAKVVTVCFGPSLLPLQLLDDLGGMPIDQFARSRQLG